MKKEQGALAKLAYILRPEIQNLSGMALTGELVNTYLFILAIPLLIIDLIWLSTITDFADYIDRGAVFFVLFVLGIWLERNQFAISIQVRPGVLTSSSGSLLFILSTSAAFIFGPSVYWLVIIILLGEFSSKFTQRSGQSNIWAAATITILSLATNIFNFLISFWVYERLGGVYPLALTTGWQSLWPAIIATVVDIVISLLLGVLIVQFIHMTTNFISEDSGVKFFPFLFSTISVALITYRAKPFSILAALIYSESGVGLYLFFLLAVVATSWMARELSDNVRQRNNRARELQTLESLGREINKIPPDINQLISLFTEHLRGMFVRGTLNIWLSSEEPLYQTNSEYLADFSALEAKVKESEEPYFLLDPVISEQSGVREGVLVPIQSDSGIALGFVLLDGEAGQIKHLDYVPALQSLAGQVSSALYRFEAEEKALLRERMTSELELAGRIQANFLPKEIPQISGYDIAASITPARQTSGDFYDFIPFADGRLGVLIADVADKGTGAALFMALSRTLLRTYAFANPDNPEVIFKLANERIIADTQEQLFITAFYAVIDPKKHTIHYANAGHNPIFHIHDEDTTGLIRTGIPLGIFDDAKWTTEKISFSAGDKLIMYTDGVTEAQGVSEEQYGEPRLLDLLRENKGWSADEACLGIVDSIKSFVGDAPQFDDVTMVIVQR